MSDTEKQGHWTAFVFRYPPASSQTLDLDEETRLLQEAGYDTHVMSRGETRHETKEQADAALSEMVR